MSVRLSSAVAASLLIAVPALVSAQPLTFEKSLTVGASPSLDVSTGSGDVTVQAGAGSTLLVKGSVRVRTGSNVPSNAAELARQLAANPPDMRFVNQWPIIMAWVPIFIFGPVAVVLLDRVKT